MKGKFLNQRGLYKADRIGSMRKKKKNRKREEKKKKSGAGRNGAW